MVDYPQTQTRQALAARARRWLVTYWTTAYSASGDVLTNNSASSKKRDALQGRMLTKAYRSPHCAHSPGRHQEHSLYTPCQETHTVLLSIPYWAITLHPHLSLCFLYSLHPTSLGTYYRTCRLNVTVDRMFCCSSCTRTSRRLNEGASRWL